MRLRVIPIDEKAMSNRSPQLPASSAFHGGVTKQGSSPSASATSLPVAASYPSTSGPVSWSMEHNVLPDRFAPATEYDAGGYSRSVGSAHFPGVTTGASLSLPGSANCEPVGVPPDEVVHAAMKTIAPAVSEADRP